MVLLFALVLLGLISALVLQTQLAARARHGTAAARMRTALLRAALTDAAYHAFQRLAQEAPFHENDPSDPWAAGRVFEPPGGPRVTVSLHDAQARFDLNGIAARRPGDSPRMLRDLLRRCGDPAPEGRVAALQRFLAGTGIRGAGSGATPTRPAGPLESWEELLEVEGFDREFLRPAPSETAALLPLEALVLIPGTRGAPLPVSLNSAPQEVLGAVVGDGMDAWVRRVLFLRARRPLETLEETFVEGDRERLAAALPFLTVRANYYEVRARAELGGQGEQLRALVRRESDGRVVIVRWIW